MAGGTQSRQNDDLEDPVDVVIDTSVAHPARVYDYWLGGKDHYPPDAQAGEAVLQAFPALAIGVRANRAFLTRAVRHVVAEEGITQILDIGTGLPASGNVHEVAQSLDPQARVVYVDNDPIVLAHAHALLTGTPGTIDYLHADLRDVEGILRRAAPTLDFDRPVALMLLMSLQFVPDEEDPHRLVKTFMNALAPGSVLVLSHPALMDDPSATQGTAEYNKRVAVPITPRREASIARFFEGLDLVEPGLVPLALWNPDDDVPAGASAAPAISLCGMGRKP